MIKLALFSLFIFVLGCSSFSSLSENSTSLYFPNRKIAQENLSVEELTFVKFDLLEDQSRPSGIYIDEAFSKQQSNKSRRLILIEECGQSKCLAFSLPLGWKRKINREGYALSVKDHSGDLLGLVIVKPNGETVEIGQGTVFQKIEEQRMSLMINSVDGNRVSSPAKTIYKVNLFPQIKLKMSIRENEEGYEEGVASFQFVKK